MLIKTVTMLEWWCMMYNCYIVRVVLYANKTATISVLVHVN